MATCHGIFVDDVDSIEGDIERGVLNEQLPGQWHPGTTRREVGAHEGRWPSPSSCLSLRAPSPRHGCLVWHPEHNSCYRRLSRRVSCGCSIADLRRSAWGPASMSGRSSARKGARAASCPLVLVRRRGTPRPGHLPHPSRGGSNPAPRRFPPARPPSIQGPAPWRPPADHNGRHAPGRNESA
jgi:hypothetical protein